ncbi:MAG: Cdc6/Cdc18 family protein [Promethearchaeota archaeon]
MIMNYFEELLKRPSVFKDESKLDINFVPDDLPHRKKELSLLSQLFLTLITNPNSISRKILITGKTGIGKTVTVKLFGEILKAASIKRDISIKYVHINCRKERTSYKVLIKITRLINENFPQRGYSPQDLLEIIIDYLNENDLHLLVVLDELSYLINKGEDLIYSLTRINDDAINSQQRLSIIGIVRDISCLNNLDHSTLSTLQRNIIRFNEYTIEQIFDIIKYRADLSLNHNALSDDLVEMISEIVVKNGDIRHGLNILWRAAKIAESQNLKYITAECIRAGNQDLVPFSTQDILKYMTSQKLIFLLAIVKSLKANESTHISFLEIIKIYNMICENIGLKSRSYSQLWNYLQEFNRESLILIKVTSENIKGRKAFIEIPNVELSKFEKIIINTLNHNGVKI